MQSKPATIWVRMRVGVWYPDTGRLNENETYELPEQKGLLLCSEGRAIAVMRPTPASPGPAITPDEVQHAEPIVQNRDPHTRRRGKPSRGS